MVIIIDLVDLHLPDLPRSVPDPKKPSLTLEHVTSKGDGDVFLLDDVTLKLHGNQLIAITGSVGSGKSSLLSVILGELPATSGRTACVGSTAYCPQTPWLFTGTISQNILFGESLDELRYQQTVDACALELDFDLLPNGDSSMIGERGVSLSGGQQSRINLARAVYRQADIYLLDDPLSSVDAKVGRHIYEHCILGVLANTLRIMVTHRAEYLREADSVIVLQNGRVRCQGKYEQLLSSDEYFFDLMRRSEKQQALGEEKQTAVRKSIGSEDPSGDEGGRGEFQIIEEDRELGSVKGDTYWTYIKAGVPLPCIPLVAVAIFLPEGESDGGLMRPMEYHQISTEKRM